MTIWSGYAALRERASIEGMVNKHMTVADIAAAVGCSEKSVRTALLRHGLKTMSGRGQRGWVWQRR